jgi:type III secretion protein T
MIEAAQKLTELPLPTAFFILIAAHTRALGVLFSLWGLYFILGPATLMRTVLAIILSMPSLIAAVDIYPALIGENERLMVLTIPLREFLLGSAIGLFCSLPFFAIMGAGIVIDQYRGDSSPVIQAPEDSQVGSFANLKVVMALFLFVEAGGLILVIDTLYDSFRLFPPDIPKLRVNPNTIGMLSEILHNVFWLLLIIAMPIMVILLLIDFGLSMVVRLSKQIEIPQLDFLLKSLVFVLAMPILVVGVARMINSSFENAPEPMIILQEFLSDER